MIVMVIVMMIVVEPIAIAVMIVVPAVIVFKPAMRPVPVTCVELGSVVARSHPASALVRRPRPVAFMPSVMATHRIPVAVYPRIIRTRGHRPYAKHARSGRRANSDSNRNLSA
jgi:hypothetical protein